MNSFENPEMLKAAQKGYAAAQKAKIYIKLLEEKIQELKKENKELKIAAGHRFVDWVCRDE